MSSEGVTKDDTGAHQPLRRQIDISLGNVLQVAQEASGWIRFALTTISVHALIYGDVPFVEVIPG